MAGRGKSCGGAAEEAGGGSSADGSGSQLAPFSERYFLKLWAFGTSTDGLGRTELDFWLLTYDEFTALKREWERERGIKPPLTKEQQANLEAGRRHILEAQMRAHNQQREKMRASGLHAVELPERKEA